MFTGPATCSLSNEMLQQKELRRRKTIKDPLIIRMVTRVKLVFTDGSNSAHRFVLQAGDANNIVTQLVQQMGVVVPSIPGLLRTTLCKTNIPGVCSGR